MLICTLNRINYLKSRLLKNCDIGEWKMPNEEFRCAKGQIWVTDPQPENLPKSWRKIIMFKIVVQNSCKRLDFQRYQNLKILFVFKFVSTQNWFCIIRFDFYCEQQVGLGGPQGDGTGGLLKLVTRSCDWWAILWPRLWLNKIT